MTEDTKDQAPDGVSIHVSQGDDGEDTEGHVKSPSGVSSPEGVSAPEGVSIHVSQDDETEGTEGRFK